VTVNPAGGGGGTNLAGNAGFEAALTGWKASTGALTRVAVPHTGAWAGEMRNTGTTSITCQLNDSPNWVATTVVGTYAGSLWVRADTAGATLKLRFREYSGPTFMGSAMAQVTLSTSWQLVTVTYTPAAPGASTLDFNAYLSNAPTGTCFYADDAAVSRN